MSLSTIDKKIDRLRSRIRRLFLWIGLAKLTAVVAALLLLSFLLDYTLHLPVGVRIASSAIALLAVAVVLLRTVAYPLSARILD